MLTEVDVGVSGSQDGRRAETPTSPGHHVSQEDSVNKCIIKLY